MVFYSGYLSDQCIPASTFAGRANMRSSSRLDRLLYVPRTKTKTLGPRGFYYASSAVCNSLPVDLRDSGLSLHSFRTKLMTMTMTMTTTTMTMTMTMTMTTTTTTTISMKTEVFPARRRTRQFISSSFSRPVYTNEDLTEPRRPIYVKCRVLK